jgi:hypothetical protein
LEGLDGYREIKIIINNKHNNITELLNKYNGIVYKQYDNKKDIDLDIVINLYIFYILLNNIKYYNYIFFKKLPNTIISYEI